MATIGEVPKYLEELSRLVPGFPPLSISNPWHIPQSWSKDSFPHAASPGVYLFSDAAGNVIYVGKASSGLGSRIGNEYIGANGICKSDKVTDAVTLHTIPVERSLSFLASAVEEFLISRLQPSKNVHGVYGAAL